MPPTCRKLNNALGHVREQLKSGKTRGANPRDLSPEEVQALEARRDQLQAEMLEAQRKRVVARVNAHTSGEAEQTREAVRSEGQQTRAAVSAELRPLTSLVAGADSEDLAERVKARRNQIALLRTCIREDLHAARKEREAAKEARAAARAESTGRGRKRSRQLSQAGREAGSELVEAGQPEEEDQPDTAEEETEDEEQGERPSPDREVAESHEDPAGDVAQPRPEPTVPESHKYPASDMPVVDRAPQEEGRETKDSLGAEVELVDNTADANHVRELMMQLLADARLVCNERRHAYSQRIALAFHQPFVKAADRLQVRAKQLSWHPAVPRGFVTDCLNVMDDRFVNLGLVRSWYVKDGAAGVNNVIARA